MFIAYSKTSKNKYVGLITRRSSVQIRPPQPKAASEKIAALKSSLFSCHCSFIIIRSFVWKNYLCAAVVLAALFFGKSPLPKSPPLFVFRNPAHESIRKLLDGSVPQKRLYHRQRHFVFIQSGRKGMAERMNVHTFCLTPF